MKLKDLNTTGIFSVVVAPSETAAETEITKPYCCDLLSLAMRNAPEAGIWCTVMNNVNTLAVASLCETACIVLCAGISPSEDVIKKATVQSIPVYKTELQEFEAALEVYRLINEITV